MTRILTADERQTLNDAMALIDECTAQGSSWSISANRYNDLPFSHDVTYFDSGVDGENRGQHNWVRGETFADKVQSVIEIEASASENEDARRINRITKLREELAKLEQAA